ncbi:hypothetical protein [Flavobacterium sp.]|uniref:hypothetical protein n=1 Tax=Flavobacterium sp. TaxID=239 RepID=UPI003753CB5E
MNDWRLKLKGTEDNYDWFNSIQVYKAFSDNNLSINDTIDINVRLMFIITYCLLEGNFSEKENEYGEKILKKIFKESYKKFSNNSDYLFCISVVTKLNEYAFDLNVKEPEVFINKAIVLNPNINLYKYWLSRLEKQVDFDEEYLYSNFINDWREKKGLLGKYIVDSLRKKNKNKKSM